MICTLPLNKISDLKTQVLEYLNTDELYYINIYDYLYSISDFQKLNKQNFILQIELLFECFSVFENEDFIRYSLGNLIKEEISLLNTMNSRTIMEYFNKLITPTSTEKRERGEVFTPLFIINNILNKLPLNVFINPYLKWFDPANGIGNFPICIYLKLMKTLENYKDEHIDLTSEETRKKWILTKMIYTSEISRKNCFIYNLIFGNEILNNFQGNTLQLDIKTHIWQNGEIIEKFDVIVGNPPYNSGGIKSNTGKMTNKEHKNETLWPKFVQLAFDLLKKDGYLCFINPLSWLKKSHKCHNLLLEKQIIYLELWDNINSKKNIAGKIPISIYVLCNNNKKIKTAIKSIMMEKKINHETIEYLDKDISVPLCFHSIFNKLHHFTKNNLQIPYNVKKVSGEGIKFKLPEFYTKEDNLVIDTFRVKEGLMVKKGKTIHPDTFKKKLIICNKTTFKGCFIDNGFFGIGGGNNIYILGDDLEKLLVFFNFKFINIITTFTKYTQSFLDKSIFEFLPDIRKIKKITEEEFYNLLNFTNDEINWINNF